MVNIEQDPYEFTAGPDHSYERDGLSIHEVAYLY